MAANAAEATSLRAKLQKATGQDFAGKGFIGVVPRSMVLDILRANHPAALDWLEGSGDEGTLRKLPLVAVTENGIRLGRVNYEVCDRIGFEEG